MLRRWYFPFLLGVVLTGAWGAEGLPIFQIGIVFDGPSPGRASVVPERYEDLVALIQRETAALTDREFDVRFPEDKQQSGDWSIEQIRSTIDGQLADPEIDLVLTLGIFATNDVCRRGR
jgi:hypothetical protein